jgi:hypothetical protein
MNDLGAAAPVSALQAFGADRRREDRAARIRLRRLSRALER